MFNSRNSIYKNPVGAVPQGQNIHFKISPPRELSCSSAYLLIESVGAEKSCLDMFWCGMNGESHEWWECDFAPPKSGIYFYFFELRTHHGSSQLFRGSGGNAVTQGSQRWQITAYDKDFRTPDWLSGGIIYQIFPDRFYKSGKNNLIIPTYRKQHNNWNEPPVWMPDESGEITNEDFFGGDFMGVEEKLPYLKSLGVSCIYFNPVFKARSNHRYDTGSYEEIDPSLGSEEDFKALCKAAKKYGIRIILDGVFSHTGSDSLYFNKNGSYNSLGAYNSTESKYYSWYNFQEWPDKYDCWWGFETLPNVDECTTAYQDYINGDNGIVRKWLKSGAAGWRLDVADELPDSFLDRLRSAVKAENPDALILGEVWEDASIKTAYGELRRYLQGRQLDTVMNYPFADAIFAFLVNGDTDYFFETIETILENYPPQCIRLLMNHIGTHDTARAITRFAGEAPDNRDRKWQSEQKLSEDQYKLGVRRMKLASLIQYSLPGVPSLYYGDEVGSEGYRDPFNRGTFPWDNMDQELLEWYRALGSFRRSQSILAEGGFRRVLEAGDLIGFERFCTENERENVLLVLINRGSEACSPASFAVPKNARPVFGDDLSESSGEFRAYGCSVHFYVKGASDD